MKKIAIIASLFCLGALSSCELKDELTGPKGENSEMGALELTVSVSESAAQSRANSEAPGNYPVVIVNKDTEEEAYNGTYEEMKKPLSLPVGTYTVNSHTPGDIKTSMTSPYYGGEKEMTITKGVVSVLDMVCKMLNMTMPKFTLHSICINTKKVYILNFVFLKKFTFPFGPF